MKQLLFIAFVVTFAIVTGCGTKPGEAEINGPNSTINMNELNRTTTPANITPVTTTAMAPTTPAQVNPGATTQPAPTTNAAGMNPAHGQPGHRCDIPVGAPLNSPVVNGTSTTTTSSLSPTQKQTVTTTTTITPPPASSTPVITAPGMNPPHGQPGHRCDIAVGAPLNSAPATTTTTIPGSTPSVNSNVVPGSVTPSTIQTLPAAITPASSKTETKKDN